MNVSLRISGLVDQQGTEEPGVSEGATGRGGARSSGHRKRLRQTADVQRTGRRMAARVVLGNAFASLFGDRNTDRRHSWLRTVADTRRPTSPSRRLAAQTIRSVRHICTLF